MSTATTNPTTAAAANTTARGDIASRVDDLLGYIRSGRIIDAMYEFYADDCRMQENNNPPTVGLAANVERERQFVSSIKQWKRFDVGAVAIDPAHDKAVIQSTAEFESTTGQNVRLDQVTVQTWRDGRIVDEKFYYDTGASAAAAQG